MKSWKHRRMAFSTTAAWVLLRSTGPLGTFDLDPKRAAEKQQADAVWRQTAIITSGMAMGFVFLNKQKQLEVR